MLLSDLKKWTLKVHIFCIAESSKRVETSIGSALEAVIELRNPEIAPVTTDNVRAVTTPLQAFNALISDEIINKVAENVRI